MREKAGALGGVEEAGMWREREVRKIMGTGALNREEAKVVFLMLEQQAVGASCTWDYLPE